MATQTPSRHRQPDATGHRPPDAARAAGIVVALTLALTVLFIAFALPAVKSKPHDVPLGVVAPVAAAADIENTLDRVAPGGFELTRYPSADALRTAIEARDVYGGFVLSPNGPALLLATGGSPAIAQALTGIGTAMAQHSGMPLRTEDLAPLPAGDSRGVGLAASALPLTLAGLLPAIVVVLVFPRKPWVQAGTVVVFAAVAALTVTALLRYVLSAIDSGFWSVSAGLFLGALATGLATLGLGSLLGRAGLGISAALAMLLGNPLSGLTSAPDMLPSGWGTLGQLLPQGANATLLRSTAYFPSVSSNTALLAITVLSCWAVAGLALTIIAALRHGRQRA